MWRRSSSGRRDYTGCDAIRRGRQPPNDGACADRDACSNCNAGGNARAADISARRYSGTLADDEPSADRYTTASANSKPDAGANPDL